MRKSRFRAVASATLAAGTAVLVLSTPAFPSVFVSSVSPPASLDLQPQATLLAKGARIQVPVTYLCPGDADVAYLAVSVTQRAGPVITSGYWEREVECTGIPTDVMALVDADAGSRAFKRGAAAATARLTAYRWMWPSWEIGLEDNEVIRIR
jgi:hypothetical protein